MAGKWLVIGVHASGEREVLSRQDDEEAAGRRADCYRRTLRYLQAVVVVPAADYSPDPEPGEGDEPNGAYLPKETTMSEGNGTTQRAGAPRATRAAMDEKRDAVMAFMATLPAATGPTRAQELAKDAGLDLSVGAYYRWRHLMKGVAPPAAPAAKPAADPAPARAESAAAAKSAGGTWPPETDTLLDFARAVRRLGGIEPARRALDMLAELAAALAGK